MDTAKYLNMIQNNPYVIERIENPTEEMKLLAVQTNGLALQYIPHPSQAVQEAAAPQKLACVLCDESQFFTAQQAEQLFMVTVELNIPVICYGLRADFKGDLFPGSYHLLVLADKLEEVKTICWCGKKAAFNARFDESGHVVKEGAQVVLGANDKYIGLCRRHWMAGDLGPDFDIHKV